LKITFISEEDLIRRLRSSDRQAVEYLYDKYSGALLGVISRIIIDKDIAEEVFHDAFVKICQKINQYDEQRGRLYTWMANLCRNAAIDRTRGKEFSQGTKTDRMDDLVYTAERFGAESDQTDDIGIKELLVGLEENQRFVLEKIYFLGYSHSEVAKEFDLPLGTVKTRLRAALQHLRKKLL
jgi:RNA polymerase sigma factor (sigma-70 family)